MTHDMIGRLIAKLQAAMASSSPDLVPSSSHSPHSGGAGDSAFGNSPQGMR